MPDAHPPYRITPEQAQARFEQGQQLLQMWVRIWTDNSELARKAGRRVEEFMMTGDAVRARRAQEYDWMGTNTVPASTPTESPS